MAHLVYILIIFVLSVVIFFIFKKLDRANNVVDKLDNSLSELEKNLNDLEQKYSPIIDVNAEILSRKLELDEIIQQISLKKEDYNEKNIIYRKLLSQIQLYEESLDMIEMGGVDPQFSYDTSEEYKEEITKLIESQKQMIKEKKAVLAGTSWTINGSKREGTKFTNQAIKLSSRAFNNEANNLIKNVSWRNFDASDKKLRKAFDDINKFNESNQISISVDYLDLKLLELQLTYEYQLKIQEEKENLAEARRRIKEEEQLEADALKAQKEEEKYLKLLDQAKKDAANKVGLELDGLNEKIQELTSQLEEAHNASARALSMAQQTKSGFVYIASNIGSFGKEVYKIGMTRRLEPMDRIKELSGASVPFVFDTHAMIYSDDAPALETQLHQKFSEKRVNLANFRKEYFRVSLNEIEEEVKRLGIEKEFFHTPEAAEYRQTLAILNKQKAWVEKESEKEELPEFI